MRLSIIIPIAVLIAAALILYMTTFTVRFTEAAVVTTFGQAGENDVITEPGLHFKAPSPIQSITVYDTRARLLDTRLEQQQTRDNRLIIVESFMTWRVSDPLVFYKSFRGSASNDPREHYRRAEETLRSLLRSAMSEVSKYELTELLTPELEASRLSSLEADIHRRLAAPSEQGGANVSEYGVEVQFVGINRLELPQSTTQEVFERMKKTRERIAASAESEGRSVATAIRSEAVNAASRIRSFAEVRAAQIRSQGDMEAAQFLAQLNEEPELEAFIQMIELMRNGFGRRTTLILEDSMPGISIFSRDTFERVQRGEIPPVFSGPIATPEPPSR